MNKKELFSPISAEVAQAYINTKEDIPTTLNSKDIAMLWDDEAKSQAFFSATAAKTDILEAFHYRVGQVVAGDMEVGQATQWMRDFLNTDGANVLTELGYLPPKYLPEGAEGDVSQLGSQRRIKLIIEQNSRQALSTGEYASAVEQGFKYLRYKTKEDAKVRPAHALLDNKVWAVDDPIWKEIYPPNSYGCRCYIEEVADDENVNPQPEGKLPETIANASEPLDPSGYKFDVTQGIGQAREAKYDWSEFLQDKYKDSVAPFIKSQTDYLKSRKKDWKQIFDLSIFHRQEKGVKYAENVIRKLDDKFVDYKKILKISKRDAKHPLPADELKKLEFVFKKTDSPELMQIGQDAFKASPDDIRNIVYYTMGKSKLKYGTETGFSNDLTHEIIFSKKILEQRYFDQKLNKFFEVTPAIKQYAFSHEYGHFVDNLLSPTFKGHLSSSDSVLIGKKFRATIQKYVAQFDEFIKYRNKHYWDLSYDEENTEYGKFLYAIKKALNPYFKDKNFDFRRLSAIQDTINGLSKGDFVISFAHPKAYWAVKGSTETETFANLFYLRASQYDKISQFQIELLNKYLPGLWDSFVECLKEIEIDFSNRYDPKKVVKHIAVKPKK